VLEARSNAAASPSRQLRLFAAPLTFDGAQRRQYPLRVLRGRFHPDIKILGGARMTVSGDRVGADDEVPDLVGGERAQQIAKVGR